MDLMRFVYAIIGFVLFVILLVVLISTGRNLFRSSNTAIVSNTYKVADYLDKNAFVTLSVVGPTVADEQHQSLRMSVSATTRNIDTYKGYQQIVDKTKIYGNNRPAFEAFLHALDEAGAGLERATTAEEATSCSSGEKYTIELISYGQRVFRYWTTSCNRIRGTMGASLSSLQTLFQDQFPDYGDVTRDLSF